MLLHRDTDSENERLGASDGATFHQNGQLTDHCDQVLHQPLTVDNYSAKFIELLANEELAHAEILKKRYT